MECNKEEAVRAKGIAENKMQSRDFAGARKIVLKAQILFPDLENISQMLTVCEVHCSAGNKLNGETDWYGILQVEATSDELTIKKQYRKLALLLHPDKNKFAGAEAAFKLVVEAHRTLSDKGKRSLHDMKRGAIFKTVSLKQPTQPPRTSSTRRKPGVPNSAANNDSNQQQPPPVSSSQTFWTICPFCGIRYQYYQTILNRTLRCQNCTKTFIAYDLNEQAVPSRANSGYPLNPTGIPPQGLRGPGAHMAAQKSYFGNAASDTGFQGNEGGKSKASEPLSRSGVKTELGDGSKRKTTDGCKVDKESRAGNEVKFEKVKLEEANKREPVVKSSAGNARQKRRKVVVESSSSETSDSDEIIIEVDHPAEQNAGTTGSNPRRSTRQKQNVTYNEDVTGDDDFVTPFKRLRKGGAPSNANRSDKASSEADPDVIDIRSSETAFSVDKKDDKQEENLPNGLQKKEHGTGEREGSLNNGSSSKANTSVGSNQKSSIDLDCISYPDPEFFDFEKERDPAKFAVDQVWSVYDDLDGMPRFYARIRNVYGPEFKVRFTWLEHDPMNKAEMQWSEEDLNPACGNFRLGKSEYTKEHLMFSHIMPWRKGTRRNSYEICPRKGEVWALFKDRDIQCLSDEDNHRLLEYEAVEILSDYVESAEITAVRLVKINGFVSLFMRAVDKEMALPLEIPRSELFRFSHNIPSYTMKGEEREGIPAGSFELDTASLPINFEKTCPSLSLESTKVRVEEDSGSVLPSKPASDEEKPSASTTKMSDTQLKEKNAHHYNRRSRDRSTNGLNREQNRTTTSHSSASEEREHVETETIKAEHQVDEKVEIVDSRDTSTNSATEYQDFYPVHSTGTVYEYPDPEFHSFEESRTAGKFERGQIWALYSDVDRFPNLYGRIKKVYTKVFRVHVTWLQVCIANEKERRWFDEELPISCGTFKIVQETTIFDTPDTFSHLVQAAPEGRRDHYAIYPSAGEVWALFKNWSAGWSSSDLKNCEYDVVEIVDCSDSGTRVLVLTKVSGYTAVFMPGKSIVEVAAGDYLRFSHQVPAFRLTDESGGRLRGYWELDPASLAEKLLNV